MGKFRISFLKRFLMIALIGICAGIICSCGKNKVSINLNDFISVDFSGYETKGHAELVFDEGEFVKKFKDQISITDMDERIYSLRNEYGNGVSAAELFLKCISVSIDKNSNLKSGDSVTVSWSVDKEIIEKEFNCKLSYRTQTFSVSGLGEVKAFDPFEGVEVVFNGISPEVSAEILCNNLLDINYTLNQAENLKKGQTITLFIMANDNPADYLIDRYGLRPVVTSKEFVVEDVPEYITDPQKLDTTVLMELDEVISDYIISETETEGNAKTEYTIDFERIVTNGNEFYKGVELGYKVSIGCNFQGTYETKNCWIVAEVSNLVLQTDGKITYDKIIYRGNGLFYEGNANIYFTNGMTAFSYKYMKVIVKYGLDYYSSFEDNLSGK